MQLVRAAAGSVGLGFEGKAGGVTVARQVGKDRVADAAALSFYPERGKEGIIQFNDFVD